MSEKAKILVVDDYADDDYFIKELMTKAEYNVVVTARENGLGILGNPDTKVPDVIMVNPAFKDVPRGSMEFPNLVKKLHKSYGSANIIIYGPDNYLGEKISGLRSGAYETLNKGATPEAKETEIKKALPKSTETS